MEIVTLVIFAVLTLYIIMLYNSLVSVKNNISKAWSNIEILLKQRHDELPKLIDTCKQYMKHEQETLERVMLARSQVSKAQQSHDITALGAAEGALRTGLGNLFALAEAYPELKANENFLHLQSRISGLENAIADRREFYNESVNINNVRIEQFPDLLVAKLFNFPRFELMRFASEELRDIDIGKRFNS
jgi:LemA protein